MAFSVKTALFLFQLFEFFLVDSLDAIIMTFLFFSFVWGVEVGGRGLSPVSCTHKIITGTIGHKRVIFFFGFYSLLLLRFIKDQVLAREIVFSTLSLRKNSKIN